MIICIFIILFGKSKKEMRAIYHALNAVLVKYSTMSAGASDKTPANRRMSIAPKRMSMATRRMSMKRATPTVPVTSETTENTAVSVPQRSMLSSIIQRLCPACRVARTETAKYLSFAQVLRYVTGTHSLTRSLTYSLTYLLTYSKMRICSPVECCVSPTVSAALWVHL